MTRVLGDMSSPTARLLEPTSSDVHISEEAPQPPLDPRQNRANMPKYFCDYCDVYLTHDSMSVRKAHNNGRNHLRNVVDYYQQIGQEKAQSVIDSITASYNAEGQGASNPMLQASVPPGFPGAFGAPPGMPGMGMPPGFPAPPPGIPPMPMGRGMPPLPPGMRAIHSS